MFNNAPKGLSRMDTIYRLPAVIARTGLSRSTIYLRMTAGTFPKAISLGERAVGWLASEISEWQDQRIEESRRKNASADLVRYNGCTR